MPIPDELISKIKNFETTITRYPHGEHSPRFEHLIAEALGFILKTQVYSIDSYGIYSVQYVQWLGSVFPIKGAPGDQPDIIGHCHTYHFIGEATRKTQVTQCDQEFAKCKRHFDTFISFNDLDRDTSFILFITPTLHSDTYDLIHTTHVRPNPHSHYQFVPIEIPTFIKIIKTASIVFTLTQFDFLNLLNDIIVTIKKSPSLTSFQRNMKNAFNEWQKRIMESEKNACISCLAYSKINTKKTIESTQFSIELEDDPIFKKFRKILGERITDEAISQSLIDYGFARKLTDIDARVQLLQIVPSSYAKKRIKHYSEYLESIA